MFPLDQTGSRSQKDQVTERNAKADDLLIPQNDRTYESFAISDRVRSYPAMLGLEERVLPAFLATKAAALKGEFVELGCYLGGSTVALLDGLAKTNGLKNRKAPLVHSYDLFIADDYMVEHAPKHLKLKTGESFFQAFLSLSWGRRALRPGLRGRYSKAAMERQPHRLTLRGHSMGLGH